MRGAPVEFQVPSTQPLRRAVRRLRWFKSTFEEQVAAVAAETGVRYRIDGPQLTRCFLEWVRRFEAQKPGRASDRHAYVGFSAGLMLQQLIRHQPLVVEAMPGNVDRASPPYFWPEGYVYVVYCLNVRRAVLEQEFHEDSGLAPTLSDLRTWWSFKENVAEDPALAVAFLDLFAGERPDWSAPTLFKPRLGGDAPSASRPAIARREPSEN